MKGTVKFFNDMKGFGFVKGEDEKEYFVHISALPQGVSLQENDAVVFDVEQGDRGPKAVNVNFDRPDNEPAPAEESSEDEASEDEEPRAE